MINPRQFLLPAFLATLLFLGFMNLDFIIDKYYVEKLTDIEISSSHVMKPSENCTDPEFSGFNLDDTDKLEYLRGKIATHPELWGFSEERGNSLFPPFTYPNCSDIIPKAEGEIDFDAKNGFFSMLCPNMSEAVYVLGPEKANLFTNHFEIESTLEIKTYNNKVKLEDHHEWVYASCKLGRDGFELFDMKPRFREDDYQSDFLGTRTYGKPLTIAMLALDSFSRRHFFRKVPKTVELLNAWEKNKVFKIFDLKIHNIQGWDTARNQAFIFGEDFPGISREPEYIDKFGEEAIWTMMRKQGFKSLLGFEACAVKMHRMIGMHPDADHVVNPFYCAATVLTNYDSGKDNGRVQRCIGQHMSHYYLMKYSLEFAKIYNNRNKFIYNHFTAAHEYTGQHASTIDDDLVWYLNELIEQSKKTGNELIIFLGGDHGMRYGNFLGDPEALQEQRLCSMYLIARENYYKQFENSLEILEHNSRRLTTKGDLRKTLLAISGLPTKTRNSRYYVNLMEEYVRDDRTCKDANIRRVFCSHYDLRELPKNFYDSQFDYRNRTESEVRNMITQAVLNTIEALNLKTYVNKFGPAGYYCKKLVLAKINEVLTEKHIEEESTVKILFSVTASEAAEFNLWFEMLDYEKVKTDLKRLDSIHFPIHYRGKKIMANVIRIDRTDSYAGPCEKVATSVGLDAEMCICNPERFEELS
jgi:hypothetical protein